MRRARQKLGSKASVDDSTEEETSPTTAEGRQTSDGTGVETADDELEPMSTDEPELATGSAQSTEAGSSDAASGERVSGAPTPKLDLSAATAVADKEKDKGDVYLVVGERCRVQIVTLGGEALQILQIEGAVDLWGIACVGRFVYVTDRDRDCVHVLSPSRRAATAESAKARYLTNSTRPFFVMPAPTLSLIVLPRHPRPVIPALTYSPSPSHPRPRPRCATRRGRRAAARARPPSRRSPTSRQQRSRPTRSPLAH